MYPLLRGGVDIPFRRVSRATLFMLAFFALLSVISPVFPQDDAPLRLRAIVRQKYPLLFVRENSPGRPEGMAVDVLETIASRSGISLSWVVLPDDADVIEPLREGKGDFVADWGKTESRSAQFDFSKPYITLPVNVYIRKESTVCRDTRLMAGLRVGVVRRNISDDILSPRTDLRVERFNTVHDALFHLLSGEIDAVAHPGPALFEVARAAGIEDKIVKVEPAIEETPRCFTFRKGDAVILARLNRGLELLIDSHDYQRILLKWFPPPTPYWTWRRILAFNGVALFLLAVVLGARHYSSLLRLNRALVEGKRLEEELRRSEIERISAQKYEAVGKLAAGMAHKINNLMMIVTGYGSLLLEKMDPLDPRRKEAREILSAGDRAAAITAQLLAFSRRSILIAKVEAIDALVDGLIPSLRAILGDGIEFAVRKESAGALVRVDARQFAAGIEELARNAKDAMPEGGKLDIATGTRTAGEPDGTGSWSPAPGPYATVSLADTGCGMEKEALSHLFEPFYTTKGFGRGMGLPSVYGFVKQSSGFIEVESVPGQGTKVTIGLPLSVEKAPP